MFNQLRIWDEPNHGFTLSEPQAGPGRRPKALACGKVAPQPVGRLFEPGNPVLLSLQLPSSLPRGPLTPKTVPLWAEGRVMRLLHSRSCAAQIMLQGTESDSGAYALGGAKRCPRVGGVRHSRTVTLLWRVYLHIAPGVGPAHDAPITDTAGRDIVFSLPVLSPV